MAPTTRAAAQRLNSLPAATDVPEPGRGMQKKPVAQSLPISQTGYLTDDLCRILELPAELRNRIYEYAAEELDDLQYAPRVTLKAPKAWAERQWQFFGLTQTCRQIRAEFGPMWLLRLNVRGPISILNTFITVFVVNRELLSCAPRRVQIMWDTGMHDNQGCGHNLTRLLQLYAHNPSHFIAFIPERLVDGISPDDICWYCFGEFEAQERGDDDYENWVESCTCAPEDLDPNDWEAYTYDLISRTDILRAIIRHNNKAWQQDVRSESMEVRCIFGMSTEPITFRILCKECFCEVEKTEDASAHARKAWELLQNWGIFEMPTNTEMKFEVIFKIEQKLTRGERIRDGQHGTPRSTHHEI